MSYWDEITARLAALSGVATPQVARQQLREFDVRDIEAVRVSEGGGGGGGNVPFVGVDPPASPTDGMLWWDPDDDTPAPSETLPVRMVTVTFAYNTPNILTGIPFFTPAAGEVFGNAMGYLLPDPVFDGTSPCVNVFRQGDDPDTDWLTQEPLAFPNVPTASVLGINSANIGPGGGYGAYLFPDATPVLIAVRQESGGDPNDPTPMSQGEATLVLFIQAPA